MDRIFRRTLARRRCPLCARRVKPEERVMTRRDPHVSWHRLCVTEWILLVQRSFRRGNATHAVHVAEILRRLFRLEGTASNPQVISSDEDEPEAGQEPAADQEPMEEGEDADAQIHALELL